jgi:hypothetical protein
MNKLLIASLLAVGTSAALANGIDNSSDHGYSVYRQVVLGDTSVSVNRDSNEGRGEDVRVPGGYARYLMYVGQSKADALEHAARVGELPGLAPAAAAGVHSGFSSQELYRRTVLGRSDSQILAERDLTTRKLAKARGANN